MQKIIEKYSYVKIPYLLTREKIIFGAESSDPIHLQILSSDDIVNYKPKRLKPIPAYKYKVELFGEGQVWIVISNYSDNNIILNFDAYYF